MTSVVLGTLPLSGPIGMYSPGPFEFIVILFLALLFFGRRLPQTGRSLGEGIQEFKKGLRQGSDDGKGDGDQEGERGSAPAQGKVIQGDATDPSDVSDGPSDS